MFCFLFHFLFSLCFVFLFHFIFIVIHFLILFTFILSTLILFHIMLFYFILFYFYLFLFLFHFFIFSFHVGCSNLCWMKPSLSIFHLVLSLWVSLVRVVPLRHQVVSPSSAFLFSSCPSRLTLCSPDCSSGVFQPMDKILLTFYFI